MNEIPKAAFHIKRCQPLINILNSSSPNHIQSGISYTIMIKKQAQFIYLDKMK
uniref:Uncharacterized protein n=1 Tax=uncultured marine thaumarchaeote KM3_35_D03 TaxID=1456132 RepID=A0A075GZ12_9ARCH|nr:hypothetical protein [uncultured marine thaumarchaeote KM3_35_D03]